MPVRKKPTAPANVDEFILSAASSRPEKATEAPVQAVKLRVPQYLLSQIDATVNKRRPAPSRHQWILEAIYEKLDRDRLEQAR